MKLESIPVHVTPAPGGISEAFLMEIAELREQLADNEVAGAIDLRSRPMSDDDRSHLQQRLGRGEVSVRIDVAGLTEVWETSYAGVWWVRHHGGDDRVIAEEIAVTRIPEILISPREDVQLAAKRIITELNSTETSSGEQESLHV